MPATSAAEVIANSNKVIGELAMFNFHFDLLILEVVFWQVRIADVVAEV